MKEYDVIVIGSGAGAIVVQGAMEHGYSVALVDKGPLGGTCLNVGCIPSKMLVYPADRIAEIIDSGKLGIAADIRKIDFNAIMERMRRTVSEGEGRIRRSIGYSGGLDYFEGEGHFTGDYTIEVKGETIRGKKIFVASGARPYIPPIRGIDSVDFLTNENVLGLKERPESLIIIGGGYIAAEYAHFFAAMGTGVTLLQRNDRIVPDEEPEISDLLREELSGRMKIFTGIEATEVKKVKSGIAVVAKGRKNNVETKYAAEKVMVAAGRMSNADLLRVGNTGIKTDSRNYIKVNEYFETDRKNIWALGDAIGKKMFRHAANREAWIAWDNAAHNAGEALDYSQVPHAVFSYPEIASVGLTEAEAIRRYGAHQVLAGKAHYDEVARGEAMAENRAFAKAVVKKGDGRILGFHIIGPHASILIQEVINAMANDQNIWSLAKGMRIHPALPELIITTLSKVEGGSEQ